MARCAKCKKPTITGIVVCEECHKMQTPSDELYLALSQLAESEQKRIKAAELFEKLVTQQSDQIKHLKSLCKSITAELPDLWGDHVRGGKLGLVVDADTIEAMAEAAR
jgi:hypothetical protein